MKYFAILKDSFREAIDAKVMYVLVSLSTLAIVFVATLTFTPLPANEAMAQFFPTAKHGNISIMFLALNYQELKRADNQAKEPGGRTEDEKDIWGRMAILGHYQLTKVELLEGEPDSPHSTYLLTISERTVSSVGKNETPQSHTEKGKAKVRQVFQRAEELGYWNIEKVEAVVIWRQERVAVVGSESVLRFCAVGCQPPQNVVRRLETCVDNLSHPPAVKAQITYSVRLQGTARTVRAWPHTPNLFFTFPIEVLSAPLGYQVYMLSRVIVLFGTWVAILIGVIVTSFFIPNMLTKGTVDLLLVKPVERWKLLLYKYVGGLTFIFLCLTYAMIGIWLVIGLRTGMWINWSLLLILTMTFFFAILYALSTLVGIMTRSTIAAIMATLVGWFVCFLIGWAHEKVDGVNQINAERQRKNMVGDSPSRAWEVAGTLLGTANNIIPRTEDLNQLNDLIIYSDLMTGSPADISKLNAGNRPWWEGLLVSSAWIAVFLGLACLRFTFKDY